MSTRQLSVATVLGVCIAASAALAAAPAKGQWVSISDGVLAKLTEQGVKPAWPGATTGVVVDRATGDVSMIVCGQGVWRSSDKGATFARVDSGTVGGRCETGYTLQADPNGKRLACFMLDGKSGRTLDGGKTWTPVKNVARGYDWAAVDWSQESAATVFARVHEHHDLGVLSRDGGKTWKELGNGFGPVGLFGGKVLVASKGKWPKWAGIFRSTDGGQSWQPVSDATPIGVLTVLKGTGYWLTDRGLLKSTDEGKTWQAVGEPLGAAWGPYFGKDEKHFVVVNKQGFQETADGGQTWQRIAPYPPSVKGEFNMRGWFLNFAWDPIGRVCYVARMGQPTCKCEY